MQVSLDGCTLRGQTAGEGPLLVLVPGGAGQAHQTDPMREMLKPRFEVVSYDRRGISRSPLASGMTAPTIQTHADDLHGLIETLGGGVLLFATSIGCLIALDLFARYPHDVVKLVAHEPPDTHLLSGAVREETDAGLARLAQTFQIDGTGAALGQLGALIGLNPAEREADAPELAVTPQFVQDMSFYFEHDLGAAREYRLDIEALRAHRDRVIVGAGEQSGTLWTRLCAQALAQELDLPLTSWPGGHNGPTAYPKASARAVIEALAEA
ncbi:alpha/beta fold hydrolase [Amycolatopsis halotolerans]|uniref:Alpha/beta fold hydrolase n=1 Tax=Amycolatopsis halotolerans TaxID=330083 RepID=A0ABV7Q6Y3_9PSEU